jgi:hypothetical protein
LLQFRGSVITSNAGLLPYRELDDMLGLTDTGGNMLADARTGTNGRHRLVGLLRQSVVGRLAGYEDVNDADRLCRDPAMRWVVGDRAITGSAASASQMGRFETKWLSRPESLAALTDLPGRWIDKVHTRRPPRIVVLDMDSRHRRSRAGHPPLAQALFKTLQYGSRMGLWGKGSTACSPIIGWRRLSRSGLYSRQRILPVRTD